MIRRNDEHWIDNLVGLKLDNRIAQRIHAKARAETAQYVAERVMKGKLMHTRMHETVFCAVTDRNSRILDVAANKPDDLILDNFGLWLAAWIRQPSQGQLNITVKNDANVAKPLCIWRNQSGYRTFNNGLGASVNFGTYVRIGSSTANPARGDYNVGSAFATSPESGYINTNSGSYASGVVSLSGSLTAGGSGTVNETGLFLTCIDDNTQQVTWMMFHDLLGSGVSFVAGNTLTTSYSINI